MVVEALSIIISSYGAQNAYTIYEATEGPRSCNGVLRYEATHNFYKEDRDCGFRTHFFANFRYSECEPFDPSSETYSDTEYVLRCRNNYSQ